MGTGQAGAPLGHTGAVHTRPLLATQPCSFLAPPRRLPSSFTGVTAPFPHALTPKFSARSLVTFGEPPQPTLMPSSSSTALAAPVFGMPTGGAAIMREGPNLLKLARKEQCLALAPVINYRFYRVFPNGEVQYLHPKDEVYPEKVNPGRQGVVIQGIRALYCGVLDLAK